MPLFLDDIFVERKKIQELFKNSSAFYWVTFLTLRMLGLFSVRCFLFIFCLICSCFTPTFEIQTLGHGILEGTDNGCWQPFYYFVTPNIQFHICLSQSKEYQRNGRSIIELIKGRGYMPTCRVLHLLLWMLEQVKDPYAAAKEYYFLDVGANIGKLALFVTHSVSYLSF
jgi:hypothetical protein